jgi:hypothetical protein
VQACKRPLASACHKVCNRVTALPGHRVKHDADFAGERVAVFRESIRQPLKFVADRDRYDDESQRSASRGELGAGVLNRPVGRTMAGRRNRPVLPPLQSISKFVKRCRHPKHHASRCGVLHCLGDHVVRPSAPCSVNCCYCGLFLGPCGLGEKFPPTRDFFYPLPEQAAEALAYLKK